MSSVHTQYAPPPVPVLDFDLGEFDEDSIESEALRRDAFENSEHGISAVFMDRLDERFME